MRGLRNMGNQRSMTTELYLSEEIWGQPASNSWNRLHGRIQDTHHMLDHGDIPIVLMLAHLRFQISPERPIIINSSSSSKEVPGSLIAKLMETQPTEIQWWRRIMNQDMRGKQTKQPNPSAKLWFCRGTAPCGPFRSCDTPWIDGVSHWDCIGMGLFWVF